MSKKENNQQLPPEVERYLALCQRAYQRMVAEDKWPWPILKNDEDMVDSEGKQNDL